MRALNSEPRSEGARAGPPARIRRAVSRPTSAFPFIGAERRGPGPFQKMN